MKHTTCLVFAFLLLTTVAPSPAQHNSADAATSGGTIAYVRGGAEIRLINPDGGDDRRVWSHPRPELAATLGVNGLAWRPDGKELAFSSGHEATRSLYLSDLYAIRPDGTGLRRLTNPPDPGEYARFPKGSVSVTLRSGIGILAAPSSMFIVYVAGAAEPQSVALPPGGTRTLTFENVADLGAHPQPVVAMFGKSRWFIPGVDVQAGRTVQAGVLNVTGRGLENFGAFGLVWRSDASQLLYGMGNCAGLFAVPSDPTPGSHRDKSPLAGNASANVCTWDWGPTPDTANKILMGGGLLDPNIYLATEGDTSRGVRLVENSPTDLMMFVKWLPDGSGFLFSKSTGAAANIYEYGFATKRVRQLTHFDGEFARFLSVSPDGQQIVFERAKSFNDPHPDLWLMRRDGRDLRLLVRDGADPSWGR